MPGDDPAFKTFKVPGIDILVSETQGGGAKIGNQLFLVLKNMKGAKDTRPFPLPWFCAPLRD